MKELRAAANLVIAEVTKNGWPASKETTNALLQAVDRVLNEYEMRATSPPKDLETATPIS